MKMKQRFLFFLFLLISLLIHVVAFSQDEGDVKLIEPIIETPPIQKSEAEVIKRMQTFRNWGIEKLNIDSVMNQYSGKEVKICICDTGQPDHEELKPRIAESKNFTTDESVIDKKGHSTHVAGIINEIAPNAFMLFAKVLNDRGIGQSSWVANGINWCVLRGANVINLSLGSSSESPSMKAEIEKAIKAGVIVIAAAGNSGQSETEDRIGYPAKWDEVIAVGSINQLINVSHFSSSGPNGDVVAPGEWILSTFVNNKFVIMSGTSMAAPFVSGMTALLLEKNRLESDIELKFEESANDMLLPGFDVISFHGHATTGLYKEKPIDDPVDPPNPEPERNWLKIGLIAIGAVGLLVIVSFLLFKRRTKNQSK